MPYLDTAQQWLTQSQLLLQARPTTTRITSKYTISPLSASKSKSKSSSKPQPTSETTPSAPDPSAPRATLTLKTYDPASGTTLKYNTNKAAEVSRLIQILGRLARPMAGLPEVKEEDVSMAGVGEGETEVPEAVAPAGKSGGAQGGQAQAGAGKGKGKKKGKK